jgi:hypothetical protein
MQFEAIELINTGFSACDKLGKDFEKASSYEVMER